MHSKHCAWLYCGKGCKQFSVQSGDLCSPPKVFYAGEGVHFVQRLSPVLLVGFASSRAAWVVPKRPLALERMLVSGRCSSTFCNKTRSVKALLCGWTGDHQVQ